MAEERPDKTFRGKGRKKSFNEKRSRERNVAPRDQESRNDVSWYSRNPTLLAAAGSIPFPYRPGMFVPWITTDTTGKSVTDIAIPGIVSLNWYPTVGYSQTPTDPASIVGKEIFAKVREKFSGSIDADAPDFVIYVMALDSIFSYIAMLKRVYRILTAYTSENHYIPDALLRATGLSAAQITDLKNHRMQLFQCINELVFMTRKFNIPAVFDIINRHYWLNDNVYMDADSINSQFYVFRCLGYYKFEMKTIGEGIQAGGLTMTRLPTGSADYTEKLFAYGRELIDALASSDDAYIISGYLMRAYDGTPAFSVDELLIDEKLIPHYDPEVLIQIENALPLLVGSSYTTTVTLENDVTQDPSTNSVVCVPTVTGDKPYWMTKNQWNIGGYVSIRSDQPTVADVTIATRLKMGVKNDQSTDTAFNYQVVCGSEILDVISVWYYTKVGTANPVLSTVDILGQNELSFTNPEYDIIVALSVFQSFDWHPIVPLIVETNTAGTFYTPVICGDVHNLTRLDAEMLEQLNRVCLYSEFNAYGQL